jgi:hypothetical protein
MCQMSGRSFGVNPKSFLISDAVLGPFVFNAAQTCAAVDAPVISIVSFRVALR